MTDSISLIRMMLTTREAELALPRNPSGKMLKRVLREELAVSLPSG
ncbi:hypothetical protein [Roseomonas xinghualingensis]|nr:hypothetical protein [Roseomonas sp. SXEYE001]MCV4209209.1 hypothetical protein [Roseomonas sp. SXEYE001]